MSEREPQIVGMGGGGFSQEPSNPRLDDYVLGLAGKARPKVCFLPTASGDAEVGDLRTFLLDQDLIYVGGGSTVNLLAVWRAHGVDAILREAWQAGVVLTGLSAGMICWFESSVTDSFTGAASALHFTGRTLCAVVSSRPGARAWRLEAENGAARETEIVPRTLGV